MKQTAIVENWNNNTKKFDIKNAKAEITRYKSNEIIIKTNNIDEGFLILTDTYYPTWHAKICPENQENCSETKIYLTDYNFRGIIVPPGSNKIIFYNKLF